MSEYLIGPGLFTENVLRLAFRPEKIDTLPEQDYKDFLVSLHNFCFVRKDWSEAREIINILTSTLPPNQDLRKAYLVLSAIAVGSYPESYNAWVRCWFLYDALRLNLNVIADCLNLKTDITGIYSAYEKLALSDPSGAILTQGQLFSQYWMPRHPLFDQVLISVISQDDFF